MPRYPFYVVIKGKVPGVYQNWTDVAVNIEPRDTSIWQGCASLDDARAIFKRHQDNGTVTATAQSRIKLDVPLFLSAPPLPISGATRSSGSSSTSSRRTNRSRRRVTVESESESESEDEEPEELGRADYAAAMPSGPHTPARGGSRQGTPARGRARAASPTPAAPAATATTPATRTNVEEERRASHRARRPTTRNTEQAREGHTRTRTERTRDQAPSGPSSAARERRNILIKNVFMADTVNVSTSRFCSSRSHAAQGASPPHPQTHTDTRPPPTVHESSSASEDEMFVSPFAQGRGSGSSPDTEIDVELGLDDDMDSGPEAVSEVSFMPSPRRPRNPNLHRETSAPASRYGTPLSRQGSGSVTAVSRVHERTKTTSKSSSSRTETQTQRRAPSNVKAEGPGLVIDTGMKRLSLSSSPPTGETQREDGQLPWTWQRPLDVHVPDTDFSISAALRSNKSRSLAGDVENDIVPTRPNTPPPPPPIVPAAQAASRSSSSSQRSQRPASVVAVASIKLCDGCSQPLPHPPLPPPRSVSKSSSESSKASTSVRPCRSCYQPLPSVTVTPTSGRGSGFGSGSSKMPSGSNTIEHAVSPAIRTSRSDSGPRSTTSAHSRSNSTSTHVPPSPNRHRNALGLAGTGLSSPSSPGLQYSGAGSDPRSPLGRSDTLSEIGSPRAQMMSFQSLSVLS